MNRAEIRQQLVDHYLDYYALAVAMLEDDDDARDTVQEALARTLAKAEHNTPPAPVTTATFPLRSVFNTFFSMSFTLYRYAV